MFLQRLGGPDPEPKSSRVWSRTSCGTALITGIAKLPGHPGPRRRALPTVDPRVPRLPVVGLRSRGPGPVLVYNPCDHTELPKVITRKARALTPEEFDRLLAALPNQHRLMVATLIEPGLRRDELIALKPAAH